MPRRNRSTPENNIDLNLTYERTLGSLGGIRAEGSAEADLGSALSLKNNRLSGGIDFAERTANLNTEIGLGKKLSGSLEGSVKLNERGGVESIGGGIGVSIAGFGGGLSADSQGNAAISAEAFGGKVEVARDSSGAVTVQICYGIGIAEFCTTFSRDKGDPQNEGSLKLGGGIKPSAGGARPQKPKAPTESPKRPEPRARKERDKPERPKPERPVKPIEDKQPNLVRRVDKKPPVDIRKKPAIDLRKKPPIDLKKKPPKPPKKPPKPPKPPKKPPKIPRPNPEPPAPINLKKPVPAPTPNPTKPPRPTPVPKPPRPPRPKIPTPGTESKDRVCPDGNWVLCGVGYKSLEESLPLWLADYIYYTDYEPGKDGTYEQRLAGNIAWNNANWTTEKGGWSSEVYESSGEFINTGAWVFKVKNLYWDRGVPDAIRIKRYAKRIRYWPNNWEALGFKDKHLAGYEGGPFDHKVEVVSIAKSPFCNPADSEIVPPITEEPDKPILKPAKPRPKTPKPNPLPRLPNKPTKPTKPMDKNCCKKVDEIYKYLGIAKLKKNKFPVAKTFLAPGGTGNEDCEDYYQLNQALFRMLANGLILNPVASPHGNTWQTVNATAWAGQVYEMVAEAMSNGDSSQKFEITMAMQVTQLLTIIAEQTRKIEFLSEVIGIAPDFDIEEVPACFTIYEGHKGFGEKQSKKIDITKAKTDTEVEEVLGKMLKPSKIPITKWVMREGTRSIVKIITEG
ncbi:MAG: hypothetical protein P2A85_09170 [Microcoleus anatoxicus]|uniref:hypothetical protein n=1 Tax=Microcoleus anatoxicus TaxID=2705319 RepID=UPI00366DF45A